METLTTSHKTVQFDELSFSAILHFFSKQLLLFCSIEYFFIQFSYIFNHYSAKARVISLNT